MRSSRWLAGFAVAVVIGHHIGTLLGPLGTVGPETEWADWVDLLTPYVVVGTACGALLAAGADRRAWVVAAVGALITLYLFGYGDDEAQARQRWAIALKLAENAIRQELLM